MTVTKPWLARWAIALGLAATLTVWPLGCAPDEHSDIPEPPPGAELARLSDTLKDMDGKDVRLCCQINLVADGKLVLEVVEPE